MSKIVQDLFKKLEREFPENVFPPSDVSVGICESGKASYGAVTIASITSQKHKLVAAKIVQDPTVGIQEAKNYLRLRHQNITKFFGVTADPQEGSVVLLLELADSDFAHVLKSTSPQLNRHQIKS